MMQTALNYTPTHTSNERVVNTLTHTTDWTQHEQIRAALHQQPGAWVCGTAFLQAHIPTYSQRIGEMIANGDPIVRDRCTDPAHSHRSQMGAYKWGSPKEGSVG